MSQTQRYSNSFDFIRFFAASLVIFGHSHVLLGVQGDHFLNQKLIGAFPPETTGVYIFFAISGFLVTQSALSSSSIKSFFWKRLLRIFPGLLFVVLFSIFVIGISLTELPKIEYLTNPQTYASLWVLKLYPYYSTNLPKVFESFNKFNEVNGSLWTLAYEFTCYIALAVGLLLGILRKKWIILSIFLIIWISMPFWINIIYTTNYIIPFLRLNFNDFIVFGLYFYVGTIFCLFKDNIPLRWYWAVLAIIIWFMYAILPFSKDFIVANTLFWLRIVCLPYLFFYLAFSKSLLNQFGKIGDLSYGIYIFGYPIQQSIIYLTKSTISESQLNLFTFLIVLPMAWLSWHYIEKPALKYKNYIE
jgi:peptidoglycan/LPS O-acetylase OafA/YrhL